MEDGSLKSQKKKLFESIENREDKAYLMKPDII